MPGIHKVHWSEIPSPGPIRHFAVWPEPVDHDVCFAQAGFSAFADTDEVWDRDFSQLISDLVVALEARGDARLVAGDLPVCRRLPFGRGRPGSISDALRCAATDDRLPTCFVEFGAPARASLATSDGHPIVWVALAADSSIEALLRRVSRGRPIQRTDLDWSVLAPEPGRPTRHRG